MAKTDQSTIPQLAKKFEPWKVVIVGLCAVIASLVGIAAMGANARGALDKKADAKDVAEIRDHVSRIEQSHADETDRLDRIENKVDQLLRRR